MLNVFLSSHNSTSKQLRTLETLYHSSRPISSDKNWAFYAYYIIYFSYKSKMVTVNPI